ncbi:MAG: hypothetical protein QOF78_2316, partial [Phycisphaerales bacterium]|nr:hypothetical protein [Phycisphaerales bacterium]
FVAATGGLSYFLASNANGDPQLWRTTGTSAGTQLVADLRSVAGREAYATGLVNIDGTLFISLTGPINYHALIRSDGAPGGAGTVRVKTFAGPTLNLLAPVNGTLLLAADDGVAGRELWRTDGTEAGTVLLKEINPGSAGSNPAGFSILQFATLNDELYFPAEQNSVTGLWKSDGTAAGTVKLADTPAMEFAVLDGLMYYAAIPPGATQGLWRTDGTPTGTVKISAIMGWELTTLGDSIYFRSGNDFARGDAMWRTDGTTAGTVPVNAATPTAAGDGPIGLVAHDGALYYTAVTPGIIGRELWRSDGTAAGSAPITNIADEQDLDPFAFVGPPLVPAGDLLFFAARHRELGMELWKTDGTVGGTVVVEDINATDPSFVQKLGTPLGVDPWGVSGTAGDDDITITVEGIYFLFSRNGKNEAIIRNPGEGVHVNAFDGNDRVDASTLPVYVVVHAGEGNDSVATGSAGDTIAGVGGADTLYGGGGDDRVDGGAGNDSVWGNEGNDTVIGQAGVDSLYGNGGNDRLEGGNNSDHMRGNGGRDRMFGGGGNDRLYGGASGDWLYGQAGNDQLLGEGGTDRLYGDDGASDTLRGGAGDDLFFTLDGVIDQLFGDGGHDTATGDDGDVLSSIEARV